MTAQTHDSVLYRDQVYSIVGVSGNGLFDPRDEGVEPVAYSTACWRGYNCSYEIVDNQLQISRLNVGLSGADSLRVTRGKGLTVFGRPIEQYEESGTVLKKGKEVVETWTASDFRCSDLAQPVGFNGGLLLGANFIRELYVHMGFHPSWSYRDVHELVFDNGILTSQENLSLKVEEVRSRITPEDLHPDRGAKREEIEKWIDNCFSLAYTKRGEQGGDSNA